MITEFLDRAGRFSGHWAIVITVGIAFLLLQLALSVRLYLRTRRQDRVLDRLMYDIERGGSGRRNVDTLPWSFSWLRWVMTAFPANSKAPTANFSRDEALAELDTRIASDPSYLLLQRMGIMAPLLGVVLTVVGFYWLKVDDSGEQSLQTILVAVTPLVSGVGAGAMLALINQVLMQGVGARLERLRMSARTWFDAAVWRHVGADAQGAANNAVVAIEGFARTMTDAAQRHAASTSQLETMAATMKLAAAQFGEVVGAFQSEMKGIPDALFVLRDATAASAKALQDMVPAGARAVANLDVSVSAFRTTIDREFTDAAKLQVRASRALASSIEQIGESTDRLKAGADDMKHAAEANAASFHKIDESLAGAARGVTAASELLRRSIEADVTPSQHTLHGAATSFAHSAEQLSAFIEQGLQPATRELAVLHETLAGVAGAANAMSKLSHSRADLDRLAESLGKAAEIADAISALPDQIRGILEEVVADRGEQPGAPPRKLWLGMRPR